MAVVHPSSSPTRKLCSQSEDNNNNDHDAAQYDGAASGTLKSFKDTARAE